MGSVPRPQCARGQNCYHVRKFAHIDRPPTVPRVGDLCDRCQREHAGGIRASDSTRWIPEALEVMFPGEGGRRSLWDLFELDTTPRWDRPSDLGQALTRLDAHTLDKLKDWLEENRGQAIERYDFPRWHALRTTVGLSALLEPLPPKMQLLPDTGDGLPFRIQALRTDGKTWDLNIPIRAELLRRMPRKFGERDYARLLGMSRRAYRRLREAIKREGFSPDRFTPDTLWRIVYGKKRGPDSKR